ncbi:MAG: thioredoxin family protein [Chlamydiales bacterium]|nr:thioredoxin family protein [Chlamydiales bacterium]
MKVKFLGSLMMLIGFCYAAPEQLTFDQLQTLLNTQELAVVDVYADWCGPCQQFGPIFERTSERFEGQYRFFKVNGDKEQKLTNYFRIEGYPTVIYYKKGKEIGRFLGFMDEAEFNSQLKEFSSK